MCIPCQCRHLSRSKHCVSCGKCVDRFDHHCPWIGNCVGAKNLGLFYCFLWVTEGHLLGSLWVNAEIMRESEMREGWELALSVLVIAATGLFSLALGNLITTQTFNLLYGKTTSERFSRSLRRRSTNPQHCSLLNCLDMCCDYPSAISPPPSKPISLATPLINA